jgi:transcriptional regulator with XRE-family HTH domain
MATVEYRKIPSEARADGTTPHHSRPLHRVSSVRKQQGVSIRTVCRQTGMDTQTARQQEDATSDLRLSELLRWQKVLDVPLADLLEEPQTNLSNPVMQRARMLKIMKTAAALAETAPSPGVERLSQMLIGQLLEMMPELAEVSAWPSVGQRRSRDEVGRVVERRISDDILFRHRAE